MASGNVYYEDKGKRLTQLLHSEKLSALEELMASSNGKPLLVAYEFQSDLEVLSRPGGPTLRSSAGARRLPRWTEQ